MSKLPSPRASRKASRLPVLARATSSCTRTYGLSTSAVCWSSEGHSPYRRRPQSLEELFRPIPGTNVHSGPGLRLSWIVYRGPSAHVSFDPVQMKTWMDTRLYANSPWSPPFVVPEPPSDGRWVTQVNFEEPGEYVLRAVASDGSLFTYENVMVTATR